MRRSRSAALAAVLALTGTAAIAATDTAHATTPYTVQTLHFAVNIGPAGNQPCDIIGDLYTPNAAAPTNRVPAILTTNGFGGSKNDQAGLGAAFASNGYVVLSYSGLGFGGSGCKITLDDPDYDGKAASQLISYLGGAPGIAFTDAAHTTPAPTLNVVKLDALDHSIVPTHEAYDPRVGMIGGSYGGEIQFSAADVDKRLDTIIPLITWNDLNYSLDPNNTDQVSSTSVSSFTPGAIKLNWGLGFSAEGVIDGVQGAGEDPMRLYACPNFADWVCPALVTAGTTGYFAPDAAAAARHASVASYMSSIRIPVLLMQGENDTLFNLNEAVANYDALKAQGTPVKMIWQSWGHSGSTPAPGELSLSNPDPVTQYESGRVFDWFNHYLKGSSVSTGPNFAYFRDWISYTGNASPAYATASALPTATRTYYLSGGKDLEGAKLVTNPLSIESGVQAFTTPGAGAPTNIDPTDVLSGFAPLPTYTDPDGTLGAWSTLALTAPVNVVGSPTLTVKLTSPSAAASETAGPAGELVLFVKIEDQGPSGPPQLIHGLEAPIRVPNVTQTITVRLPAIVHQFAIGHKIRLVVAGGSINYRGGLIPTPVAIFPGSGQRFVLPIVP